jgi:tRNA dimethylallyltransferase
MGSQSDQPPLIVLVGETGSGKSALAIDLAQIFDGEIIAADSRTIYRGLDIVTAKPTSTDLNMVPHHLLDVVTPDHAFSAADFKLAATRVVRDIAARGRVAFLVGGTGLYVDAVIYDFAFKDKADLAKRGALQSLSVKDLQAILLEQEIPLPRNELNPRHLIRAIETGGQRGIRSELRPNTLILGLAIDREELKRRIIRRVDGMIAAGLIDEIDRAAQEFGWDAPGLQTPGFKAFKGYLDGDLTIAEAKELFVRDHLRLAKRQRTWFRRNQDIHWISKKEEAVDLITTFLNK